MASEPVAPVRIDLPSGGWWEIETRPRWKVLRKLRLAMSGEGNLTEVDLIDLVDRLMIELSIGWSFEGVEINEDTIGELDIAELGPVFQVIVEKIVPLFEQMAPRPSPSTSL